jgi:hypothetical protein
MSDVIQELGHLTKLAKEDPQKRFNRLYLHHPSRLRNAKRVRKGYGHVTQAGLDQQGQMLCAAGPLEHHHGNTRQ